MVPTQTLFHGPVSSRQWICLFEAGGYHPSLQDTLSSTPFYPASSQRILALSLEPQRGFGVIKVETLLKLARERAGEEIHWEEWKPYLVETSTEGTLNASYHWLSGFRLFSASVTKDGRRCDLHVYDFSPHARMKFLHLAGDGRKVIRPSVVGHRLPWNAMDIHDITFGHDSMVVQLVSHFLTSWNLVAQ
jgi:hypothetical protein